MPLSFVEESDNTLLIIIQTTTATCIMILAFHLLYHLFFKLADLNKFMKILCTVFSIAYIPMSISNVLTETVPEHKRKPYLVLMNASYDVINVTLYLIIVLRFYDTFSQTMYQLSKKTYVLIFTLITIYFLAYNTWFVAYLNGLFSDETRSVGIVIIMEAILLIDDMILSVVITYLFCKSLFKLTLSLSSVSIDHEYDLIDHKSPEIKGCDVDKEIENEVTWTNSAQTMKTPSRHRNCNEETLTKQYDEMSTSIGNPSMFSPQLKSKKSSSILSLSIKTSLMMTSSIYYNKKTGGDSHMEEECDSEMGILSRSDRPNTNMTGISNKQQQLIAVATRLMILTVPAVVTTTLVWAISLTAWIALYNNNMNIYHLFRWLLHVFFLPLDGVANFLCVYLNFKFSRTLYNRLCCGINRFCENCWAIVTELKVEQMRKERIAEVL